MMELPITVKPDVSTSLLYAILNRFGLVVLAGLILTPIFWGYEILDEIKVPFIGLMLAFSFILAIQIILTMLNVKATVYKITHEGVYFKEGFFTRREKFLPLKKATDVKLVQRWPLDIWYNTGLVVIETAGWGSTLVLRTVQNPKKYYEALKELILKEHKQ